jgi:hypothetical protein
MSTLTHQLWQAQVHIGALESNAVSMIHIKMLNDLTPSVQRHEFQGTTKVPAAVGFSFVDIDSRISLPRKYVTHSKADAESGMGSYTGLQIRINFLRSPVLALSPLILPSTD